MCMIWGFRDAKKENGVIVVIVKYFLSTYLLLLTYVVRVTWVVHVAQS